MDDMPNLAVASLVARRLAVPPSASGAANVQWQSAWGTREPLLQ